MAEHNPGVNLDGLDFEAIDKEIIADEAAAAGATVVAVAEAVDGAAKVTTDDIPGVDEDLSNFLKVRIRHCYREANHCADAIARRGALMNVLFPYF